jgi:GTP-binding protein HflX
MKDNYVNGILVAIFPQNTPESSINSSFNELERLADTAGVTSIKRVVQKKDKPDPATYIGKGKIEELKNLVEEHQTEVIIVNDSLSPVQVRNLEEEFSIRVIDRTQLILDIFARRAQTKESKLQVELAQLQYLLPRLHGFGKELSRLGGGIGTRGPGETKLETDRRRIRQRIADLKQQLVEVKKQRALHQSRRKKVGVIQVALTGYTNAGKSSILNRLSGANVLEEDRLFATLDPTMRKIKLPVGIEVVLIDTVGFIQDLPTHLVAAFRSTLEVVKEADLILHVIDSSDSDYEHKQYVVEELLRELDAIHIPRMKVYNKKDLATQLSFTPVLDEDSIWISINNPEDQKKLIEEIEKHIISRYYNASFQIPFNRPDLKAELYKKGHILRESEEIEEGIWIIEGLFNKELNLNRIHGQVSN